MQKIVEGSVHFRNYILGKFFVRRFYSRHISSWLNYSGEFIVRRFYSSRNNWTPFKLMIFLTIMNWINVSSCSLLEKMTLHMSYICNLFANYELNQYVSKFPGWESDFSHELHLWSLCPLWNVIFPGSHLGG